MALGFQVTFDAHDTRSLAGFWAAALGYILQPPPPGYDSWEAFADEADIPQEDRDKLSAVVDPEGKGPRLLFQKVPEGKTAKNRMHLDVNAGAGLEGDERKAVVDAKAESLAGLGATLVAARRGDFGEYWVVMQDPEGNEFCVQ